MFSDTHFHFKTMTREWGVDGGKTLSDMAARDCFFGMDIGTKPQDLEERVESINKTIAGISDAEIAQKIKNFVYYSAGIWPEVQYIHNRQQAVKQLEDSITAGSVKIVALGECGLDHHWNPSGVDGRSLNDFDEQTFLGEQELFKMQLELARKLQLPVIIHSRDAFEDTYNCLKEVGYHNGIIHCYSYGYEEALKFLDLGWYISFAGSVTYTKKSKLEDMNKLLKCIPEDRILCETDSPYLAPVPHRGTPNSPYLVQHVYEYIAPVRGTSPEKLSEQVDSNIKTLFKV